MRQDTLTPAVLNCSAVSEIPNSLFKNVCLKLGVKFYRKTVSANCYFRRCLGSVITPFFSVIVGNSCHYEDKVAPFFNFLL